MWSRARTTTKAAKSMSEYYAADGLPPMTDPAVETTKEHERTKEAFKAHPLPLRDQAMYHGLLGDLVKASDPHTEADKVGVLVSLLGGVGAIIGPDPHVMIGSTRHPLLIWPLLFGNTSSGRKGEASNVANAFLQAACPIDFASIRATGLSSGEGLIERIKDPVEVEDIDDTKVKRRRDENPGTIDKRLLVTEPEFASVMARCKREANSLPGVMREAWEGRDLGVLTKAQTRATGSHITIAGHITPKEFRLRMAAAEMAGGTYNRFLPVYVERSKLLPLPTRIDDTQMVKHAGQLRKAITLASRVDEITMGVEASAYWTEHLYQDLAVADEDHVWSEFAQRAAPYARRISALYAALDGRHEVTLADLSAAAALVTYSMDSAKYVLDNTFRDPRVDKIQRAIDESPGACLTRSQISGLFGRNLTAGRLDELLDVLLIDETFQMIGVETAGRTAQTYLRVKPLSCSFVGGAAA